MQFSELQKPSDLDLDHTAVPTDGHFGPPLTLLGRLGGIDYKTN